MSDYWANVQVAWALPDVHGELKGIDPYIYIYTNVYMLIHM